MATQNPGNPPGINPPMSPTAALAAAAPLGANPAPMPPLPPQPQAAPPYLPPRPPVPAAATTKPYEPGRALAFFLWMSKTDTQGIGHCTYEAVATQAALGAMVTLTGLFALSSSFFLVYSIADGAFGAAWLAPLLYASAIVIFDRELVGYTPASDMSAWRKFLHLLPRLLFACVLGYSIAIPMEHKLMEKAIEEEIAFEVARTSAGVVEQSAAARAEIKEARQQLKRDLDETRTRLSAVEQRLNEEYTKRGGRGPVYARLEDERNRQQIAVLQAQEKFTNFRPSAEQEAAAQDADKIIDQRVRAVRKDILKRTEALQRITERSAAANLLSWLIVSVFILLELFPIILKLFQRYNEYHAYIEVRRRIAIQKNHVLCNHALEFIDKFPAEAARMEMTDIIQSAGEDPITSHLPAPSAAQAQPMAGANPYMQMMNPPGPPPRP